MTQTVTNRAASTYENVLTVNQPLTSVVGSSFTCTVTNALGSDTSSSVQVTAVPVNECQTNNGGCEQICTDTATSFQCSCRSGFTLATNGRSCNDINECNTNNGGCAQICTNTPGSRVCSCRSGFTLVSDGRNCQERLTVSIAVDYTRPADFNGGPNEYRAASGPVTVTCTATGAGSGTISYQWSSTCSNCPFQSATSSSITRAAVHSGDTGTHTCVATRGGATTSASIDIRVVDAGVQVFRGSPRGNHPNNGLVVSDSVGSGFRFRIFCRSDSMSANVGEIIGLNGNVFTGNSFFAIARSQPGEITIVNTVGSQSAVTASQQGVYTCRIPLQNGVLREFNIGIYPSEFNTPPRVTSLTSQASSSSSSLTCTSTGSPATTVTWRRNGQPVTIGSIYQMTQTVTNRAASTYENVLTVNQPLASVLGSSFTCTVTNALGSDTSSSVQVTAVLVNECQTNNGGCTQICTDTATSFRCSCRSGFTLGTNGRSCNDINECNTNNGGCAQTCTNTQGSRQCSCNAGFVLASNRVSCTEQLTCSISVDYTSPDDFTPGPNEYRAASGPVTVTCTATGPGSGTISYQWSSTCRNCPFQSATSSSIRRAAVHSGDTGVHTCACTRGGNTATASIDFSVVDAGIQIFRGIPRGNFPLTNGLVISDNPSGNDYRFRIFCRSDSMMGNVGEFIGLDGNVLSSNSIFSIANPQAGELRVQNRVGSQSSLAASQEGVYTCRIPLQNGEIREINVGVYSSGFNTPPTIVSSSTSNDLELATGTSSSSSTLTCTTAGSPPTTVSWIRDGQPLTIDGDTYQMTQTVINRASATFENVLTINQPLASIVGRTFTCTVTNVLGSDTSDGLQVPTTPVNVNECNTNNGGCEHICTDTDTSFQCSCRPGFTLDSNGLSCTERLTVSISVDYSPPTDFNGGPNEYRAASGPVTVTCIATGPGSGTISYQWSSNCRNCPFQSATSSSITRFAVHSGDTGIHTCVATQNGITASASINFQVVGSGIQLFRGSPRGSLPNNGLAISENPGSGFRLRIFCRSDSMSRNIGQFIGLNGNVLTSNSNFAIARPQPGEITVENIAGSQSALTASQQGVYTCRIPLQSGEMREINVGIYPNGFNTQPRIVSLTLQQTSSSSFTLTCTTSGSPATTVTWRRNGQLLTIDGNTFEMTQTVTNRAASTYENALIIDQPRSNFAGNTVTCTVENSLGTATATSLIF